MAAKRANKKVAEQPPENENVSANTRTSEKGNKDKNNRADGWKRKPVEKKTVDAGEESNGELPYVDVPPLPQVPRTSGFARNGIAGDSNAPHEPGYKNRAPLQFDERARDLITEALKMPINLTTEDLLNVSESARQELKRLLTKKRLEKKTVAFVQESDSIPQEQAKNVLAAVEEKIDVNLLPEATYEISTEDKDGIPKGSLIVNDPVLQYLSTMSPGEKPKTVVVASESQGLRAVYPLINNVGEVESLLDGGSQIVSMSKDVAVELEIPWDPDITVQMQSANRTLEQTLGLAKNVPFLFGHITVYLQVHVMGRPAYRVLLGRPFDTITESVVKNTRDGGQSLTLTDPNSGERCVMHTHERGKPPTIIKKPIRSDFQPSMI